MDAIQTTIKIKPIIKINKTAISGFERLKINKLRRQVVKSYHRLGETTESIDAISTLLTKFHQHLQQTLFNQGKDSGQYNELVEKAVASAKYQRFSLMNDDLIKISLHIMPKGMQIPMHAHPGMFSATLLKQGRLQIRQDSWGRMAPLQGGAKQTVLESNEINVGLPVLNNLHQIQVESDVAVFFSLRMKLNPDRNGLTHRNRKRLAIPGFVMGMMFPFISLGNTSGSMFPANNGIEKNYAGLVLASEREVIFKQSTPARSQRSQLLLKAEKMRLSGDYELQVEAVAYYQQFAQQGDAESQYWLGVMFLDGSGITEDNDAALEWISRAADQDYPPAKKLLAHLLATDFDMDC